MGQFECICGNSISLNSIPEFLKAFLITDIALDDAVGDDVEADRMPRRSVYECDKCGRLWIGKTPANRLFVSFVPEQEPLRFRDDYGAFGDEYHVKPKLDEADRGPAVIGERMFVMPGGVKKLAPGERRTVSISPMQHSFLIDRAVVSKDTPSDVFLHSVHLREPTSIKFVLSDECAHLGGQHGLFERRLLGIEESVDFDVENRGSVEANFTIIIFGFVR